MESQTRYLFVRRGVACHHTGYSEVFVLGEQAFALLEQCCVCNQKHMRSCFLMHRRQTVVSRGMCTHLDAVK